MDEEVALQFAADVSEAVASVRELTTAAQELAAASKEASDGVAQIAAPAGEAASATKELADSSAAAAAGADEVGGALGKAAGEATAYADAAARVKGANAEIAGSSEAAAGAAATAADAQKAAGAASEAASAKSGAAGEAAAAGGLGKYKMALVGIGVASAVAVDQAGKFQDQTTHLVTDAGESASKLGQVQQGILSVSSATGTSASQITDAMYHIESSGFHAATGLAILKTTAEGAKVGGADLDTTSKALVGTLTAYYGTSLTAAQATKDSTSLMNQLITTVGSGDMRMQDLASSISAVTPVAAAAHISFAQVGGALATMTAQGMTAQQASQNLAHAIRSLTSPTNVQSVEMKAMGLNANDVAKNLGKTGLAGTLNEMRDAVLANTKGGNVMLDMLKGMSPAAQGLANQILTGTISTKDLTAAMKELNPQQYALVSHFKTAATSVTGLQQTYTSAMSKMLGGATGLNVGLMLTGTHMKDLTTATSNIAAEGKKASSTVDNWSTIQGTFAFKMQQAKASIQDTGISLGMVLLPAVTAILGPIAHFLALIASNHAAAIAFAVVVGGIMAGALGTKLVHALKSTEEAIKSVGNGAEWLIGKLTGASAAGEASAAATEAQTAATEALTAAKEESVGATEAAAAAQAELDAAEDANPIGLIIIAIVALIAIIVLVVTHLHWFAHAFDVVRHAVAEAGHDIASAFDEVRHVVSSAFDEVRHVVASAGDDIVRFFEQLPGRVLAALKQLALDLVFPIGMAVHEITTHTHEIAHVFDNLRHEAAAIVDGMRHDIAAGWDGIRHDIAAAVDGIGHDVVAQFDTDRHEIAVIFDGWRHDIAAVVDAIPGDIRKEWDQVRHDTMSFLDGLRHDISAAWDWLGQATRTVTGDVVSFFTQLPGKILAQLAALPGKMVQWGEDIINGVIRGVENAASQLLGEVSNLAGKVEQAFTNPLSIFSPSRVMFQHGVNYVQGIIDGVKSRAQALKDAVGGLSGGLAATSVLAGSAAGAAAGGVTVHASVPVTVQGATTPAYSDPAFSQYLQGVVQEAVLRYGMNNPGNGLNTAWGRN